LKERPAPEVPSQEETAEVLDEQRLAPMGGGEGGGTIPIGDGPTQVEMAFVDALPCTDDIHVNEAKPQLEDVFGGNALAPGDTAPGM
jgi:hypothetical protein